jgi:hypothetical protein
MCGAAVPASRRAVRGPVPSDRRGIVEEARIMAKGQKRSNKEIKKPKQVKPKAPAGQSTLSVKLDSAPDRGKGKK